MTAEAIFNDLKLTAFKKVYGEHSLTVGEVVCFLLGVAIIVAGHKAKIPSSMKLPLGLIVIGIGEVVF
jgi:hypothetical protein